MVLVKARVAFSGRGTMIRKIVRRIGTTSAPSVLERAPYTPLKSTLEDYARRHGMQVMEDITDRRWARPQCIMYGPVAGDYTCSVYLSGSPGDFSVDVLCWRSTRLVGRRRWTSQALNGTTALRSILEDAFEWVGMAVEKRHLATAS
jgi:hypothetical protein